MMRPPFMEDIMKLKHYELTPTEIMAIRDSLDTQWHDKWKQIEPYSPLGKEMKTATRILLDQFKQDVFNI